MGLLEICYSMSCVLRSCMQPQHCHPLRSNSCHCVLSEIQPYSADEWANIHGQKFPLVNSLSHICLCICCQRFCIPLAFIFFRQACRHQHPWFSFLVLTPTHTFLYFLLSFSPELSQQKQSFTSVPHLVRFAAQLMEASVWERLAWAANFCLGSSWYEDEKFG